MSAQAATIDVEMGSPHMNPLTVNVAASPVASSAEPNDPARAQSTASQNNDDLESDAGTETTEDREVHYRRGKNKVTQGKTLAEQLQVTITNSRMKNILNKFKSEEDQEAKKKAIIAFKAATDPSYLIQSSVEEIWMAVKRREAWAQVPYKMMGTSIAQVVLCLIAMMAYNSPVNGSTVVMASIYTVVMAAVNPFDVTMDLVGIVEKEVNKIGRKHTFALAYFLLALVSPILAIPFGVTIIFDFFVGKVLDCSYGSLINIVVDAVVKATAISVGLRSANPINAIQTFVGFEFISEMDEIIIASVDVDMLALTSLGNATPNWNQSKRAKMTRVRVALYVLVPSIVIFWGYTTIYNVCYLFCDEQ